MVCALLGNAGGKKGQGKASSSAQLADGGRKQVTQALLAAICSMKLPHVVPKSFCFIFNV